MRSTDLDRTAVAINRRPVNRRDLLAGCLVAVTGAVLYGNASTMDVPAAGNQQIGPDIFPLAISALMTVLGLLLAGKAVFAPVVSSTTTHEAAVTDELPSSNADHVSDEMHDVADEVSRLMVEPPVPARRLLVVLAIFTAYLVLLVPLGFIISTILFMGALTTYVAPKKLVRNVIVAVATSVLVSYCFSSLLGVELPVGLLGW
jgi:putative tricarboxylic transport membrane protein